MLQEGSLTAYKNTWLLNNHSSTATYVMISLAQVQGLHRAEPGQPVGKPITMGGVAVAHKSL
jgi:hypothetical protein